MQPESIWQKPADKKPDSGRAVLLKIRHRNIPVYRYSGDEGIWGSNSLSDEDVEYWAYAPELPEETKI